MLLKTFSSINPAINSKVDYNRREFYRGTDRYAADNPYPEAGMDFEYNLKNEYSKQAYNH